VSVRQKLETSLKWPWVFVRYAIALALPFGVALLQELLGPYGLRTPQVFFLAGVFVVAWVAGPGPGGVASVLSATLSEVLFIQSTDLLGRIVAVGLFLLLCVPVLLLTSRLQRAERHALALSRIREEFLAAASHELRGPLTALSFQIDSIARDSQHVDGQYGQRIGHKANRARRTLERMTRLIELLMDVTRIQAGKLTLDLDQVDLVEVVREVVARVNEDDGKACRVAVEAERPIVGAWDRARLDQVLTNLISNACKYGEGKPVRVAIEPDRGKAKIVVRDEGPGIPADQQARLFNRFERIGVDRRIAGTGLGLWITRQIVDAHGGKVRVESDVGKGSTFIVELPWIQPANEAHGAG